MGNAAFAWLWGEKHRKCQVQDAAARLLFLKGTDTLLVGENGCTMSSLPPSVAGVRSNTKSSLETCRAARKSCANTYSSQGNQLLGDGNRTVHFL